MLTLEEYMSLRYFPGDLSDSEKLSYIFRGYHYVIQRIRIDLSVHPLRFQKHTRLGTFSYPGQIVGSMSEIAFKQIKKYSKCIATNDYPVDQYAATDPIIGDISQIEYSYSDFESVNQDQSVVPAVAIVGNDIYCENVDDALIIIEGYPFPYLVKTEDEEYIDEHRYSVEWMFDSYGPENLYVEPALGVLVLFGALIKHAKDNLNLERESLLKKALTIIFNLYNINKVTFDESIYSSATAIDVSGVLNV